MKVLITYMSLSGNTKKIAQAIYDEIKGEKEIKEFTEVNDLKSYDLIFFGFPMHGFGAPDEAKEFMKKYCRGKKLALFVTHGAPEGSTELLPWLKVCWDAADGIEVAGKFNCQGELAQYVIDALLQSDDPRHREYGKQGHTTKGQPDQIRIKRARSFAREVINTLSKQ